MHPELPGPSPNSSRKTYLSSLTLSDCAAGSLSMFLATLPFWGDPITAGGVISAVTAGLGLAAWVLIIIPLAGPRNGARDGSVPARRVQP